MELDKKISLLLNGSNSIYLNGWAWTLTQTSTWLPLFAVLLFFLYKQYKGRQLFLLLLSLVLCVFVSDQIASSVCKPLVARWRPTQDPTIMHLMDIVRGYRGGNYGFFSSHAANTCSIATFLTFLLRNKTISFTFFAWSLLSSWTRLYLGVHFVGDILVGLIFGGLVGYLAYRAFLYFLPDAKRKPTKQPSQQLLPYVFLLTLTVAAIPWRLLF